MLKKKSIVLSDVVEGGNKKAVLALQQDNNGVFGTLRLYNFSSEPNGISSLGVNANQKIYKAGLTFKSYMLYEFFIDLKEIPAKFSCAVINFQNAIAKPILYGSSEGSEEDIYGEIISKITEDNSARNTESVLNEYDVDFEAQEKQEIEKEIDKALCSDCKDCEKCVYKKYFYEHMQNAEVQQTKIEEVVAQEEIVKQEKNLAKEKEFLPKEEDIFVNRLMPQIDKLFEKNPVDENLQNIIPSSKWVKVDFEDDGDFYVFGLLFDDDHNVKYVCYGVPAVFEEEAPSELAGFPIWVPLDKENAQGFGYWLTYQDAITGEPVKAVLD